VKLCSTSNVETGSARGRQHHQRPSTSTPLKAWEWLRSETGLPAGHGRRLTRLHRVAAARKTVALLKGRNKTALYRAPVFKSSQLAATQNAPPGIQQAHLAWNKIALYRAPVFTGLLRKCTWLSLWITTSHNFLISTINSALPTWLPFQLLWHEHHQCGSENSEWCFEIYATFVDKFLFAECKATQKPHKINI
jgi:hypothetical protein